LDNHINCNAQADKRNVDVEILYTVSRGPCGSRDNETNGRYLPQCRKVDVYIVSLAGLFSPLSSNKFFLLA